MFGVLKLGKLGASMKKAGLNPRALFSASEQGAWYDPSDLSTMYQDAAGATPVYMPGQGQVDPPVGLLLDKRLGLARGPERLVNGDFSAGAANWSVSGNDATHIATFSGGTLRFQSDTTSPVMLVQQLGAMVVGRWYEITVTVSAWVSGSLKSDNFVQESLPLASGAGVYKVIGLAAGTTGALRVLRSSANVDLTIDSISIREVLGNHAYQTTTTSRPTLSARYNLLTYSEQFDNAVWTKSNATVPGDFVTAPNGTLTAQKLVETATDNFHYVRAQAGTVGVQETLSIYAKAAGRSWLRIEFGAGLVAWFNLGAGTVGSITGSSSSSKITAVGGGWYQCSVTGVRGTNTNNTFIAVLSDSSGSYAGDGVSGVYIWGADLRPANDGVGLPPYQRVVDANTYDTAGFPPYLKFDGVDDWLQTASVDFSGTDKVTIAAALRKLTDSSVGMVAELGPDVTTTAGTFGLYGRNSGIAEGVMWRSRGASIASAAPPGLPAPSTLVAVGSSDLSTGRHELRVNGASPALSSTAQGGGTYGNYPLYIGRRGGTSLPFNGRLYSLLIRGAATPDAAITTVERYLNQKSRAY